MEASSLSHEHFRDHPHALDEDAAEEFAGRIAVLVKRGHWLAATEVFVATRKEATGRTFRHEDVGEQFRQRDPATILDEMPIAELPLPVRVINALDQRGFIYVGDLRRLKAEAFLRWLNCGEVHLAELRAAVAIAVRKAGQSQAEAETRGRR